MPSPSKVVFVGNIPYGLTEEQITDIFSGVGRVLAFRLVYDRESGRPKGFGFCTYPDSETAASAVRNLNDHEIQGRKLRVDFSNEGEADDDVEAAMNVDQQIDTNNPGDLPPLPQGQDPPPNLSAPDAISATLKQLPPEKLLDVLVQMQALAKQDPAKCSELLSKAPQLGYAVFQALLLMGLVESSVLTQVIDTAAAGMQVQQPPPQAPTPQPQIQQLAADPQKAALLQQVMQMTPEQLAALPAEAQQQIMMLKQQLMAGGAL